MTLEEALKQFDLVEANLVRLEKLWAEIEKIIPADVVFYGFSPEQRAYDDLCRAFREIRDALPAIDGWRITSEPLALDDVAHGRFEVREIDDIGATRSMEESIFRPGEDLHEYRYRMHKKRREVVRSRVQELVGSFEGALARLRAEGVQRDAPASMRGPDWEALEAAFREIDRLVGATTSRGRHWTDLRRHLSFAMACDLWDIVENDWPAVKKGLEGALTGEREPVPVAVEDLGTLVRAKPAGPVTTALRWDRLDDEQFERLIFCLMTDAAGYENPEWVTKTRAPDRGRDLSVTRARDDSLTGSLRERVIVQCKHWQAKSVGVEDVMLAFGQMQLWEPPPVDVLVIATSGRFTSDALRWIESHNHDRKRPRIEMWPESHLERLLAARPHITAEFGLR